MKYLVWHITHGVQTSLDPDYAQKHILKVKSYIPEIYRDYIVPVSSNWSALLEERQRRTWEMEKDLALSGVRKMAVNIACDLLWYDEPWINKKIHEVLEIDLDLIVSGIESKGLLGGIVRQGHSLGSQIMLDACHRSVRPAVGLITMGSPITKYSGKYQDWGNVPPSLNAWLNLYARRDLVCSSFRAHPNPKFREIVDDVEISSWNPFNWPILRAHVFYWNDPSVCRSIGNFLTRSLIEVN